MSDTRNHLNLIKLGVIVGAITGVLSVAFNYIINKMIQLMMLYHPISFEFRMLFIPITGGFVLGLIHKYYIKGDLYGFDVSGVMEEIRSINSYLMEPVLAVAKTFATMFTLAIGWSAGRHGPIVYIGGAVGSWIGYTYNFSRDRIKILVGCGVAGALAGVFNEPIFATLFFVLEVILHKEYLTYFTPVTVSAIASVAITHIFNGDQPFINIHGVFTISNNVELLWMILLGVVMGLLAVVYIRSVKTTKKILFTY